MSSKAALEYKDKGNAEFAKKNYAQAIEYYTYATEMDPNNHIFYTNRANCYFAMNNYAKSLRDADKAIQLNPAWEKGHYRRGLCLEAQGDLAGAVAAFEKCVQLKPGFADFVGKLDEVRGKMLGGMSKAAVAKLDANELYKKAKFPEAIIAYTKAIALCTASEEDTQVKVDLYANRAACHAQLRDSEAVIEDCNAAIAIQPENLKALIRRAQALEHMEKFKAALADFDVVNRIQPNANSLEAASRIRAALKRNGEQKE